VVETTTTSSSSRTRETTAVSSSLAVCPVTLAVISNSSNSTLAVRADTVVSRAETTALPVDPNSTLLTEVVVPVLPVLEVVSVVFSR
jgi:hypothetical protein